MIKRTITAMLLSLLLTTGCASIQPPSVEQAAVMDSATTYMGLELGGRELNPLGFAGTNLVKLYYLYGLRPQYSPEQRALMDRYLSSVFFGAAVNNVLQIIWAPSLFVSAGLGLWVGVTAYDNSKQALSVSGAR